MTRDEDPMMEIRLVPGSDVSGHGGRGRHRGGVGGRVPVPVAARQDLGGALAPGYDVPSATFRPWNSTAGITVVIVVLAAICVRYADFIWRHPQFRPLIGLWVAMTAMAAIQWTASWKDRPATVTRAQRHDLRQLRVVVNVPVYNEDARILDRAIWALVTQTRQPDRVDVIDDGSTEDYSALEAFWAGWHGSTLVTWRKQANGGKRVAQCRTFESDPAADIFVTVDSDSALEARALENGLKPFTDPDVWSVAGIVLTDNFRVNFLTQNVNVRTLFFQIASCGAQGVFGDVLVNRGPLALYRAQLLRDIVPAYAAETFFGHGVQLGDDAALTLFARGRGRTVQQSDAFVFSAYPETLSHHFRQWTRWMRGSTIRNCWRIRYLSPATFGWWFTLFTNFAFWPSCAVPFVIAATWPSSRQVAPWLIAVTLLWSYVSGLRCLAIRRSDETAWDRAMIVLEYPTATLWALLVLRWIRIYGICTCLRQGWNTRQGGAETLTTASSEVALEEVPA
jgi:hyaluronan synthase